MGASATATTSVTPDEYRGWSVSWDYGYYTATSPDYDASWEGEEDGWVDNGQRVSARTREALHAEVDAWFEDHADPEICTRCYDDEAVEQGLCKACFAEENGQFGVGA